MEFHPIANIFPLLDAEALDDMAASIRERGLEQPVIVFEGKILDGRNRYTACRMVGVEPKTKQFNGTRTEALAAVWEWNVAARRHLNSDQKAVALALRLKLDAEFAAEAEKLKVEAAEKKKSGKKDLSQNFDEGANDRKTDHKLAESVGTNRTYLANARKLIDAAPEAAQEVLDGKRKLHAAVKELATPSEPKPFDVDKASFRTAEAVRLLVARWPDDLKDEAAYWIRSTLEGMGL